MVAGLNRIKHLMTAAVLTATVGTGGCVDGISLNGKLFDWMGISEAALQKKPEPQMAVRAPLVLPPDSNRLPEPGSDKGGNDLSSLNDPELKKAAAAKEKERLHLAYCRGEIQWKEKVFSKTEDPNNRSPYGPCNGILGNAKETIINNAQ
jgi:hypothetical protein